MGNRPLESLIANLGVSLGGRNLPMPQRSLHQMQIPGLAVQSGGEGVAK